LTAVNQIANFGNRSARVARSVIPDPFVIAIGLGVLTFVLALIGRMTGQLPVDEKNSFLVLFESYAKGMFSTPLLAFAFKMALILITGHALAAAGPVQRVLKRLAAIPNTTGGAAALVAFTAMLLGLINWGLALVGGAFLAREVGRQFRRQGRHLNYPLVGAAGYMGLLVWHGGFSGSAPLAVASNSDFGMALSVPDTILSGLNISVSLILLIMIPLLFMALGKGGDASQHVEVDLPAEESVQESAGGSDADAGRAVNWMENSLLVAALFFVPVVCALCSWLWEKKGAAINFDLVILSFWIAGMILHRTPVAYMRAFSEGVRGSAGIMLQFPIYFGILAVARDSGLIAMTAKAMADLSVVMQPVIPVSVTAPVFTFFSSGLVNMLVPSGGGQWALQSPVIVETVNALGLDPTRMLLAFCYGDEVTNMLQPFWALPLLSITGLKAREIMGYTILAMLAAIPVFILLLAVN
jgi:short-chain fatty acids transporter